MRIGELAELTGASIRALRYYEEQGLLVPDRAPSGQRTYAASDLGRVRFIRILLAAGLGSRSIVDILPFTDTGVVTPEMTQRLADERARIQAQLHDLAQARDQLDELIHLAAEQEASGGSPASCYPGAPTDVERHDRDTPRSAGRGFPLRRRSSPQHTTRSAITGKWSPVDLEPRPSALDRRR